MARKHVRQQIREAIVCELLELDNIDSRVYPFQVFAKSDEELPAISVLTPVDVIDPDTRTTSTFQTRVLTVFLEIRVKISDTYADLVDTIAMDAEETLIDAFENRPETQIAQLLVDLDQHAFEIEVSAELDRPVALGTMTFFAQYKYDTRNVSETV